MDMRKLVVRNVRRIRQKNGLTQEQLAEVSGFSQQYISTLERGRRNPTVVTLYELATALGVSHMELVRPSRREKSSNREKPGQTAIFAVSNRTTPAFLAQGLSWAGPACPAAPATTRRLPSGP